MRRGVRDGRGFSLVELLMVIFVISVLLALLLPASHSARETSRRIGCVNNLRQIVLALHNYETQLGVLPPGVVNPTRPLRQQPDGLHTGWFVQILPYMEQWGVHSAIDTRVPVYDPINTTARLAHISTLICPSDPEGKTGRGIGRSWYAASHHDVEAPIDEDNHGVFYLNSSTRHADLADGSYCTIFVGEKRMNAADLGWMSGTRATLRNTGWPINAGPLFGGTAPDDRVGGFGSLHPGGANFAFGDGAVHYLSDTTAPEVLRRLGHRDDGELIEPDPF